MDGCALKIFEIEASLDKKTKALELLHSSGTSCSSPSEDMSVRDLVSFFIILGLFVIACYCSPVCYSKCKKVYLV